MPCRWIAESDFDGWCSMLRLHRKGSPPAIYNRAK
jgi:hypothetical protein